MDRLIFNTVIPSSVACNYGGQSWMMELVAVGDKNLAHTILGDSANTLMDSMVTGESSILAGKGGDDKGLILNCDVKGTCTYENMDFWDGFRGRMNWRILR